jgi:hypothetical protein
MSICRMLRTPLPTLMEWVPAWTNSQCRIWAISPAPGITIMLPVKPLAGSSRNVGPKATYPLAARRTIPTAASGVNMPMSTRRAPMRKPARSILDGILVEMRFKESGLHRPWWATSMALIPLEHRGPRDLPKSRFAPWFTFATGFGIWRDILERCTHLCQGSPGTQPPAP